LHTKPVDSVLQASSLSSTQGELGHPMRNTATASIDIAHTTPAGESLGKLLFELLMAYTPFATGLGTTSRADRFWVALFFISERTYSTRPSHVKEKVVYRHPALRTRHPTRPSVIPHPPPVIPHTLPVIPHSMRDPERSRFLPPLSTEAKKEALRSRPLGAFHPRGWRQP